MASEPWLLVLVDLLWCYLVKSVFLCVSNLFFEAVLSICLPSQNFLLFYHMILYSFKIVLWHMYGPISLNFNFYYQFVRTGYFLLTWSKLQVAFIQTATFTVCTNP